MVGLNGFGNALLRLNVISEIVVFTSELEFATMYSEISKSPLKVNNSSLSGATITNIVSFPCVL